MKKILISILILTILGLAIYSSLEGNTGNGVCIISSEALCSDVQDSVYGSIFGIKLGFFGIFAFSGLFLLWILSNLKIKQKKFFGKFYFLVSLVGGFFALYFIGLQIFILKQICSTCVLIDFGMIIISVLSYFNYRK